SIHSIAEQARWCRAEGRLGLGEPGEDHLGRSWRRDYRLCGLHIHSLSIYAARLTCWRHCDPRTIGDDQGNENTLMQGGWHHANINSTLKLCVAVVCHGSRSCAMAGITVRSLRARGDGCSLRGCALLQPGPLPGLLQTTPDSRLLAHAA